MLKALKPYSETSQEFLDMVEAGMDTPCDLRVPNEPPKWLDKQLFFKGQQEWFSQKVLDYSLSGYKKWYEVLILSP